MKIISLAAALSLALVPALPAFADPSQLPEQDQELGSPLPDGGTLPNLPGVPDGAIAGGALLVVLGAGALIGAAAGDGSTPTTPTTPTTN